MEHKGKGRASRDIDDVLESFGEDDTLDAFLKRKQGVKEACKDIPASDLKILPQQKNEEPSTEISGNSESMTGTENSVVGAEGGSSPVTSSTTGDQGEASLLPAAQGAVEFIEVTTIKKHEIVGYYQSTETVEYELTADELAVYNNTYDKYIADALETSPSAAVEAALKYITDCERAIRKAKRAQLGSRNAIAALLHKLNAEELEKYNKLNDEEKKRFIARKPKTAKAATSTKTDEKKAEKAKMSASVKAVTNFAGMGYDRAGVTEMMKNAGRLTPEMIAAIAKVFG